MSLTATLNAAEEVAKEISSRLALIRVGDTYETNLGLRVYRGRHNINADMVPCAVLFEGDDKVLTELTRRSTNARIEQKYVLVGYDACDADNPNDSAHRIIRDFKRMLFSGDRTLGGKVQEVNYEGRAIGPRNDGVAIVSARVDFNVTYIEDLSNP